MADPVVEVQQVGKRYARDLRRSQRYGVAAILHEVVPRRAQARSELRESEFWAVRDVSLELRPGEAVGIVGRNGAGKTTLLRMIAGITVPDEGRIVAHRRIGALIDPNAGFDPILTGRENVEAVHALLSGRRPDRSMIDDIVAYADLADVVDTPVRTYSKGMQLRLGFSLMIHLDPDILLIDEALAVGDTAFQLRCLEQLRSFCRAGGALLFVSHSLWLFQHMANRGIHMVDGSIAAEGPPHVVSDHYLEALQSDSWVDAGEGPELLDRELGPVGAGADPGAGATGANVSHIVGSDHLTAALQRPVLITRITVEHPDGGPPRVDGPVVLEMELLAKEEIPAAEAGITIWTGDSSVCILAALSEQVAGGLGDGTFALPPGSTILRFRTDAFPLSPGRHLAKAAVFETATGGVVGMHGYEDAATSFEVVCTDGAKLADRPGDTTASTPRLPALRTIHAEWSDCPARPEASD